MEGMEDHGFTLFVLDQLNDYSNQSYPLNKGQFILIKK
jgi:hypothetical protein